VLDSRQSGSFADVYSPDEVAEAAGVTVDRVYAAIAAGAAVLFLGFVAEADAVRLVRGFRRAGAEAFHDRTLVSAPIEMKRRRPFGLAASAVLHGIGLVLLLLMTSLGLFTANDTDQNIEKDPKPIHLVYLMQKGPGGGGGGGGLKMPTPAPKIERKPLVKLVKRTVSPVPPVRPTPPPPRPQPIVETRPPVPPPPIEPPQRPPVVTEPPKPAPPAQTVQAPVMPIPADPVSTVGVLDKNAPTGTNSNGPGTGGGVGSGAGTGIGEGQGGGIGPGTGGGTGGGPFQPGNGIDPPQLIREVRPVYTDEARRRAIEGDVVLEIVVRRDGTVSNMRVVRSLGAGLDQKALDAVRQWRFGPAKRQGAAVDVVVEVSVEFRLR
jgi:TonB family protein